MATRKGLVLKWLFFIRFLGELLITYYTYLKQNVTEQRLNEFSRKVRILYISCFCFRTITLDVPLR